MPIKLANTQVLRTHVETVHVLGLDIPKTDKLPLGAQAELNDTIARNARGEIGETEFILRVFCLFTWRLGRTERVSYQWLGEQILTAEEITELTVGTLDLLRAIGSDAKNASPPEEGASSTSPASPSKLSRSRAGSGNTSGEN